MISVVAGAVTAVVLTGTGVPYAIALGMIVAIFDLVPMVGATIGMCNELIAWRRGTDPPPIV